MNMPTILKRYFGPISIVLANIFFMGSFSLAKLNTSHTAIAVIMFFRFLAGPVWLAPYIKIKRHPIPMTSWKLLFLRIGLGILGMSSLFAAFKFGDIGKSTLIFELSIV
jgi:drug/metabolite transporter (DMT)-like permease